MGGSDLQAVGGGEPTFPSECLRIQNKYSFLAYFLSNFCIFRQYGYL